MNSTLIAYLETEKVAAAARMRQVSLSVSFFLRKSFFYRISFIYPRFELETQVESRLVFRSFDLNYLSFDCYIFDLNLVFN